MPLDFLGTLERTHMCGTLRAADAGQPVVLMGWVNRRRDHGNLIFLDLRDRSGIARSSSIKSSPPKATSKANRSAPSTSSPPSARSACATRTPSIPKCPPAKSRSRPPSSASSTTRASLPSRPSEEAIQNEEVRLKYRYIDLRRSRDAAQLLASPRDHPRHPREPLGARDFWKSKRPSSTSPHPKARAISSFPAASIPASSTRCRSRRRSSSRSS